MDSFTTLIQQFKNSVIEGLEAALKCLEQLLSPQSDNYNDLVLLKGRYGAMQRDLLLGMVAPEMYEQQRNSLSHALLVLADMLQPNDLKPELLGKPSAAAASAKRGEILYYIPGRMQIDRESRCAVRVAWVLEQLYDNWQTQPGEVQRDIRIAEIMGVELINVAEEQPFSIRSLSETVQFLDCNECTEWIFYVKPKITGEFSLALRVSVIEVIRDREYKKDIVLEERIQVATDAEEPDSGETFQKADAPVVFGEIPALGASKADAAPAAEMDAREAYSEVKAAPSRSAATVSPPAAPASAASSSDSMPPPPAPPKPAAPSPVVSATTQAPAAPAPRSSSPMRLLAPLALVAVALSGALWVGLFGIGGSKNQDVAATGPVIDSPSSVTDTASTHKESTGPDEPEHKIVVGLPHQTEPKRPAPEEDKLADNTRTAERNNARASGSKVEPFGFDRINLTGTEPLTVRFVDKISSGAVLELSGKQNFTTSDPVVWIAADGTILRVTLDKADPQHAHCTLNNVQLKALSGKKMVQLRIGESTWSIDAAAAEQLKAQTEAVIRL